MKLERYFKKTRSKAAVLFDNDGANDENRPEAPLGILKKCNACKSAIFTEDVKRNYYICPKCHNYFRVHAWRRVEMIADEGSFEEWDHDMKSSNPLNFKGYEEKVRALQEKTNLAEAVLTGKAKIHGMDVVLGICDGRFMMASMGEVVGEKITRAVERATREKLPVILYACSGGARMQEGIVSLMQMAKTSAALKCHSEAGLLYITVLTEPTTGGVTASWAMLGDIILAEPNALIGFAGPRVIEQTIGQKLPKGFQRAEFLLEHGFIDAILERETSRDTLAELLRLHGGEKSDTAGVSDGNKEEQTDRLGGGEVPLTSAFSGQTADIKAAEKGYSEEDSEDLDALADLERLDGLHSGRAGGRSAAGSAEMSAWDRVEKARKKDRPVGTDYIDALFEGFQEFHGDRGFRDDPAVVGGIAWFHGRPVTVIAEAKGTTTKENVRRNFGMPSPEGYRKALRLMKQAEKFHRPVICFVDTPGAFCGMEAEERGQGEAIAKNLFEMSDLKTPILSMVIGEGGSGGALALAVADEVWMMENAIYSVLSPEGFASILWKDSKRAKEAAQVMKLTAQDLKKLGIIEKIIDEPDHLTRENFPIVCEKLEQDIEGFLDKYTKYETEKLTERRYQRFRKM